MNISKPVSISFKIFKIASLSVIARRMHKEGLKFLNTLDLVGTKVQNKPKFFVCLLVLPLSYIHSALNLHVFFLYKSWENP